MSPDDSQAFFRDYMRGAGFQRSLASVALDRGMQRLAIDEGRPAPVTSAWELPSVNFLAGEDKAFIDEVVKLALPGDRDHLRAYLSKVPLGAAAVSGVSTPLNLTFLSIKSILLTIPKPAGTSKTTGGVEFALAAYTTLGQGYGTAPTNAACNVLAARLDLLDLQVSRAAASEEEDIYSAPPDAPTGSEIPDAAAEPREIDMPLAPHLSTSKPDKVGRKRHLILRGFRIHLEVQAFKALVERPELGDAAIRLSTWTRKSPWRFHLSAAFYLCLVLGLPAAGRKLSPEDSAKLHTLANEFGRQAVLRGLLDLASGRITYGEYARNALQDKAIEHFLERAIGQADIPVSTPAVSYFASVKPSKARGEERKNELKNPRRGEGPSPSVLNGLKDTARWVIIDEAGAMGRSDALTVMGNSGRPFILCGDHRQLKPFVGAPRGEDDAGDVVNRHVEDASTSVLAWHHHCGMPVYRMRV